MTSMICHLCMVSVLDFVNVIIISVIIGASNQLKPIDPLLWVKCMMVESCHEPPLCPVEFERAARIVLSELGLSIDNVTHANCCDVYLLLVQHF